MSALFLCRPGKESSTAKSLEFHSTDRFRDRICRLHRPDSEKTSAANRFLCGRSALEIEYQSLRLAADFHKHLARRSLRFGPGVATGIAFR